jgi:hypothetical protein
MGREGVPHGNRRFLMKRTFTAALTLCLMFSASYAHAFGVILAKPVLLGPFARTAYNAFKEALADRGATRCDATVHASCGVIHFSAGTGKRGSNSYVVVAATTIAFDTTTNELLGSFTTAVNKSSLSSRSKGGPRIAPEEWRIDLIEEKLK